MAEVKVLDINADNGKKTLRELQKEIKGLKEELLDMEAGSEKASYAATELAQKEAMLKASMKGAADAAGTLNNSYNGLVAQMSQLKSAQKAIDLSNEAGRKEYARLAEQINGLNNQLKDLDAQNGVFGRNVGNYVGALKEWGGAMGSVGNNIMGVADKGKLLLANPWVALIGAIVSVVMKLADQFKKSEERMDALKVATASFQPIIDTLNKGFSMLADVISNVMGKALDTLTSGVQKAAKILDKLGKAFGKEWNLEDSFVRASEAAKQLAADENAYAKHKREFAKEEAQIELEVSALRDKVAQKDKYTNEERLAFLDQAIAKEKKVAADRLKLAQENLKLMEQQAARDDNDAAANEALAQAQIEVTKAKQSLYQTTRQLNAARATEIAAIEAEADAVEKAEAKKLQAELDAEQKRQDSILALRDKYGLVTNDEKMQQELDALNALYTEELRTTEEYLQLKAAIEKKYSEEAKSEEGKKADEYKQVWFKWSQETVEKLNEMWEKADPLHKSQMAISAFTEVGSAVGNMLSAVAKNFDENSKEYKGLMITQSIISMLTGVTQAVSQAMQLGPIAGPILGAINSATVIATGIANINKIKSANKNTSPSSAKASVSGAVTQNIVAPVEYGQVTGQSADIALKDQKVYVTETDITNTQNKVSVAESEARF